MPRRLLVALVALALAPATASALTASVAVRSVASGCAPKNAFAVPVTATPAFATGEHDYVVATAGGTPCATLPVTTTDTEGAVRLRWDRAAGSTGYTIFRDGETVAAGVACCDYTDDDPTTTPGAPPPVAAESTAAGSSPDLIVTEDLAYDDPAGTLATDVLRLPAGLFLTGALRGEALAVLDGKTIPGTIGADGLTLRPEGADPVVLPMTLTRRSDGGTDVTTDVGGRRITRLTRTLDGEGIVFPSSCAAKSVLLEVDGARASAPLQATDCAGLAFGPLAAVGVDTTGGPVLSAVVTQPPGEAAARAVTLTLPEGAAADGTATATGTSPLVPGPVTVPVTTSKTQGGRSVLTLDDLPEIPFTDLRFSTPIAFDQCRNLGAADAAYVGHNGAIVTARSEIQRTGPVPPCLPPPGGDPPPPQLPARPSIAVQARLGRSGRPRLALTIRAGNAVEGSNLRRCKVRIPRGLRLTRTARRHLGVTIDAQRSTSAGVRPHLLTVRPPTAARIVTVTARRGSLRAGRRARRRLSFRFSVLTQSGRTYRITKRVTPRR